MDECSEAIHEGGGKEDCGGLAIEAETGEV